MYNGTKVLDIHAHVSAPGGNGMQATCALDVDYLAAAIKQRTGDDVLCELGISKPVVLKIDVEGAEKEVLESIPKFLSAVEPIVIMEISPVTRQAFGDDNGLKSLFGPGYDLFTVKRYRNRYKLAAFAFDRANGNILALPKQHAAALRHKN